MPTALVCSTTFANLAALLAQTGGLQGLPLVEVPHPVGGIDAELAYEKGRAAVDQIIKALT